MRSSPPVFGSLVLFATLAVAAPASATVYNAGPSDDVEAMINALVPGDELILADGTYTLSGRFSFDIGGGAEPIVIRAADGATPHFHRPDASQNIWDIRADNVVIRGLEFSGGSAGLRFETGRAVTIEGCEIHDTADVALRMNDGGQRYEAMHIVGNHIHDTGGTGEGMYLGCNSNGCQLANSVIERNWVHHTNASDVSQGDGIEIKEGSFGNVVADNVIHDTRYPCILTYSAAGNGSPNLIERNVMWNCGDHGIQSAADAVIRNNIILSAGSDGIAMQPHQAGTPSNLVVVHNTILKATNDALSVRGATGIVLISNNALYAQSGRAIFVNGTSGGTVVASGNVGAGGASGVTGGYADGDLATDLVAGTYGGAPPMNVFPAAGGALIAAGDTANVPLDDFNGTDRMGVADVGAYAFGAGSNPGWTIAAGFKDTSSAPPPTDGGVPTVDAGPTPGTDGGPVVTRDGGTVPGVDAGPGGGDDGGCGCRVTRRPAPSAWWLLPLAALALRRRGR